MWVSPGGIEWTVRKKEEEEKRRWRGSNLQGNARMVFWMKKG